MRREGGREGGRGRERERERMRLMASNKCWSQIASFPGSPHTLVEDHFSSGKEESLDRG